MLGAYLDESYQRDPAKGHAIRMTIGGCIISSDGWKRLTHEWDMVLREFEIPMFHMADFEADKGEFIGWRDHRSDDRKTLLDKLLYLMASNVELYLGTFAEVKVLGEGQKKHYQGLAQNKSRSVKKGYALSGWKITVVLARQQDFSEAKASGYSATLSRASNRNIGRITVDDPICSPALQAADILAYELVSRF